MSVKNMQGRTREPIGLARYTRQELTRALLRQFLVQCDKLAAKRLARVARCILVKPRKRIITQGTLTHDIFFILQGSVEILVGGNVIASRAAGEHVGEMAGLLRSRRTATVVSREETVLARVGLDEFLKIAESRPDLLKNLATTLAFRLNQRRNLLREPNLRPFIFIGSSKKHVPVANRIRDGLRALGVEIQVWSDAGAFPASSTFIETLTAGARQADFAVFIFGKDDTMISKGKKTFVPRDNVIFETGLFIGAIGRNRTFPVRQKNADIKVLSDLQGVTLLDFKKTKGQIDVSSACDQIAARVKKLWVR